MTDCEADRSTSGDMFEPHWSSLICLQCFLSPLYTVVFSVWSGVPPPHNTQTTLNDIKSTQKTYQHYRAPLYTSPVCRRRLACNPISASTPDNTYNGIRQRNCHNLRNILINATLFFYLDKSLFAHPRQIQKQKCEKLDLQLHVYETFYG